MEGCHLSCLGQAWTGGGLASAARQALRWSLPQAHPQGHARVTPLPACSLPGAAGHPQPRHAQLSSLPGGLALVCSHMDSSDPAASTSTACRSPASRRQAWSLAACRRTGQLVAATSLAGHHAAVGCLLPRQITARAADAAGAHRSESHLCSQDPDAARLAACRLRHQAPGNRHVSSMPEWEGHV